MKTTLSILAILLIGCAGSAMARHHADADYADYPDYADTAPVLSATPIYETVRVSHPEEECWNEQVKHRRGGDSATGTLAGGIVGGVIGNQFGHGAGNTAMTVAGSLLGASIGHDLDREPERRYVTDERHCEVVDHYSKEERVVGYRVTYRYKGQTFVTRTVEDPGDRIPVRMAVEPLDRY